MLATGPVRSESPAATNTNAWSLPDAVAFAAQHSPETRLARQRVAAHQAALREANASFWPNLGFRSSYVRTDNPAQVFATVLNQQAYEPDLDFNDVPDADNLNVQGSVTVPLYAGGRNRARQRQAKASHAAALADADATGTTLLFEVTQSFFIVHKADAFIRAAEASVGRFETNLAVARERLEAGTLLRADLLDLEVKLAHAREDLLRARHARTLTCRALRNLLGLDQGPFDVLDTAPTLEIPTNHAPDLRAELLAAQQRIAAAQQAVQAARSGRRPRLDAFASLDYDYGWKFDGDGTSYSAGVLLQWDLWDGRSTQGRIEQAEAYLDMARERERQLRLAIDLEIEQARLRWEEAGERLHVTAKAVTAAQESARLTRHRFEEGLALTSQIIDTETAQTLAEVRQAEAEADQRIALAAWRKALGLPPLPWPDGNTP